MTYCVHQHWDPLRVCVVGRSYPPESYYWIQKPHVRDLFEKIAQETEEDYQNIIKKLQSFDVEILRPDIQEFDPEHGQIPVPPMNPRDTMIMIGETFYHAGSSYDAKWREFYRDIKDPQWAWYDTYDDFCHSAEPWQIAEVTNFPDIPLMVMQPEYRKIEQQIKVNGNRLKSNFDNFINGAMVSRIGRDLYFSTENYQQDQAVLLQKINQELPSYRNHIVNTGGHGDGTYCPVAPGLIISLKDVPTYAKTFPDWEVLYLPNQSWNQVQPFLDLKKKNRGRWWIPGFEYDDDVIEMVETWINHWVGYVEETVFDVNMLIIDPKNVMVFNENQQVFRALDRYGITPHVVPFRHRYFWDGGIHCVTLDLDRQGYRQDFFPDRD